MMAAPLAGRREDTIGEEGKALRKEGANGS